MSLSTLTPPSPDTFEISVFGSGIGESIVLHLTENRWMVVDSFLSAHTKTPVALDYLRKLNVPPEKIELIVISHWHDDHIKGISTVYENAINAKVVFSQAIREGELQMLIGCDDAKLKSASATEELANIIQTIGGRGDKKNRVGDFDIASDNKPLYFRGGRYSPKVWSLSPSAASVLYALRKIRPYLPLKEGEPMPERPPRQIENNSSVVLFLKVGDIEALLGADLETEADPSIGWQAIVYSQERPKGKASFFKIPHHGSENGYDKKVWDEMLIENPWAVLTPMRSSKLPTEKCISLIRQQTEKLWSTAPLTSPPKVKRSRVVEKQMKMRTRRRWVQRGDVGQVRFRVDLSDAASNPQIDLFHPAFKL